MNKSTPFALGLDVSDRTCSYCIVDAHSNVLQEGRIANTPEAIRSLAERHPDTRWVLEAGTHSFWIDRTLRSMGVDVVVVNPRRLRMVSDSLRKTDRADARLLALLAMVSPKLLWQVQHRSVDSQLALTVLKARTAAVGVRTKLVNMVRGLVKSFGMRLPSCDADQFYTLRDQLPEELRPALDPLFDILVEVQGQLDRLDRQVAQMAKEHPGAKHLMQVPNVGPITSLAFVLVLDDPKRFRRSRDVGPYLGLTSRIDQSGSTDKQLRITKAGDKALRSLLVQCAMKTLQERSRDTALKRWGLALVDRGGKAPKQKAAVAVARKLAVLLHHLWATGDTYNPFPQAA